MTHQSKLLRFISLSFAVIGIVLLGGSLTKAQAQTRDPFAKPDWAKPKTVSPTAGATGQGKAEKPKPAGPPPVVAVAPPSIDQRIDFYKRIREDAAANGQEIPKVTSVLTLEEMAVTGIFRTPRGYAAMVEAKPIKLSYTIYPGEKFFDGQLVAIEENRLVFRKVLKMSNGKFVASVENKPLRQYTVEQEIQGTAPVEPAAAKTETASVATPSPQPENKEPVAAPSFIVSPLDEMNKQPVEKPEDSAKQKTAKKGKKPEKVAKNKSNK